MSDEPPPVYDCYGWRYDWREDFYGVTGYVCAATCNAHDLSPTSESRAKTRGWLDRFRAPVTLVPDDHVARFKRPHER